MTSPVLKTWSTLTSFSNHPFTKSILSPIDPPLTWISIKWAFFGSHVFLQVGLGVAKSSDGSAEFF